MSRIHRRIRRDFLTTEIIRIDRRNILFPPSSEHIDLECVFGRVFIVLVWNCQSIGSGDVVHQVFKTCMVRKDGEFYQEVRESRKSWVCMVSESLNPILAVFALRSRDSP